MHERCCDQHSGAKVPGDEERGVGDREVGEAADYDGEGAGGGREEEDEEEGEDVEGGVVAALCVA